MRMKAEGGMKLLSGRDQEDGQQTPKSSFLRASEEIHVACTTSHQDP